LFGLGVGRKTKSTSTNHQSKLKDEQIAAIYRTARMAVLFLFILWIVNHGPHQLYPATLKVIIPDIIIVLGRAEGRGWGNTARTGTKSLSAYKSRHVVFIITAREGGCFSCPL
jgi:hypothetical protein